MRSSRGLRSIRLVAILVACLAFACNGTRDERSPGGRSDAPEAGLPAGWVADCTGGGGAIPAWERRADATAPSGNPVLVMADPGHEDQSAFNLAWDPAADFGDGLVRVSVRPISGVVDQGGGPMWRVQGPDDYYVCRWNPLESNFRVYVVESGVRRQLASAKATDRGGWHAIEIVQRGSEIRCSLDGQELLRVEDATIAASGGVGLWTKADAVTAFDGLQVP